MLDLTILAYGKIKETYWQTASEEYLKRLKPYAKIVIEELKSEPFSKAGHEIAKQEEAKRLEKYLSRRPGATVFLLAEKGEELDSLVFSKKLDQIVGPIILIIGGSLGFSQEIFTSYKKISLSKLTFPHELARVILLEQIYRAVTILNKKEYHY
ncbi:MAG: 23S rRNA (pseudouridine(1915)-N(3))-methyltransferase RlmH [Patescibacteria group bacterium]|jgi:23S rRNA (pseudouridine1915-N3)-methyltransferase